MPQGATSGQKPEPSSSASTNSQGFLLSILCNKTQLIGFMKIHFLKRLLNVCYFRIKTTLWRSVVMTQGGPDLFLKCFLGNNNDEPTLSSYLLLARLTIFFLLQDSIAAFICCMVAMADLRFQINKVNMYLRCASPFSKGWHTHYFIRTNFIQLHTLENSLTYL